MTGERTFLTKLVLNPTFILSQFVNNSFENDNVINYFVRLYNHPLGGLKL